MQGPVLRSVIVLSDCPPISRTLCRPHVKSDYFGLLCASVTRIAGSGIRKNALVDAR
jgi:hypothetical protein